MATRMADSSLAHDPRPTLTGRAAVFEAQGITKVYRMGEVEVHALRGVDLMLTAGEFVVMPG
jgi:putative ABC transport system ATP-binding protein